MASAIARNVFRAGKLAGVRDGNFVETFRSDHARRHFLNPLERVGGVEAVTTLVAHADGHILENHKPNLVLEHLALHALGTNGTFEVLAAIPKLARVAV